MTEPAMGKTPSPTPLRVQLLQLAWALAVLLATARFIAPKLYLILLFGWSRTWGEHLSLVTMEKHQPWRVSNGEVIEAGGFVFFSIGLVCWLALTVGSLWLFWFAWSRRRSA